MFRYSPKNPSLVSETVHYKRGVSQQFSMPSFKIDFSEWKEEDVSISPVCRYTVVFLCATLLTLCFSLKLNFDLDRGVFPMVIQAVVDEGDGREQEQICSKPHDVANTLRSFSNWGQLQLCGSLSFPDCLGHAHVLLAAFERVRFQERHF